MRVHMCMYTQIYTHMYAHIQMLSIFFFTVLGMEPELCVAR